MPRIIFDILEMERPVAIQRTDLSADASPVSEMVIRTVVCFMAGLMSRGGSNPALASWCDVVMVKLGRMNREAAKVAGHMSSNSLRCIY